MTRIFAYLGEAIASLWRNKVRSTLTMLGMIIGTSSIIAVFGLSKAATSGIESTLNSFGTFPISVQVDTSQNYPDRAKIRYGDAARVASDLGDSVHEVQPGWTRHVESELRSEKRLLRGRNNRRLPRRLACR